MRGQAAMEFVFVFVGAFIVFIVIIGLFATMTIGFSDRAPHEAETVLDVVSIHTSTLIRFDSSDEIEIEFTIPQGALADTRFGVDNEMLFIEKDGKLLASRRIPGLADSSLAEVEGTRTLRYESGGVTLA